MSDEWRSMATKAAVGVVAALVLGVGAWYLSREDEVENIQPLVDKKIGTIEMVNSEQGINVIDLKQLLKIMDIIKEQCQQKMEGNFAKKGLTKESFIERRFELYQAQDWPAYEELLMWESDCQEKAFAHCLDIVATALKVEKGVIMMSSMVHGQSMESLSAMTDSLADQEKSRKPKLSRPETIEHLCYVNGQRTEFMIQAIKDGKTEEIKNSSDPQAKQTFYYVVNCKASDQLFAEKQVSELELSFASRFYKADQEPTYQNQVTGDYVRLSEFKLKFDEEKRAAKAD